MGLIYISIKMKTDFPSISKQLTSEQMFASINKNFSEVTNPWFNFQMEWLRSAYFSFKDHDKYLIIIYLVHKTMKFFSNNLVKLDYDNYYLKDKIEISNFNIINISKDLFITKETARRKVLELEKIGVLKRDKKKIILDRKKLDFQKPDKSIGGISSFLSKITGILYKSGDIDKKYSKEFIENYIRKNFTNCWRLFYEMQIPLVLGWKKSFGDFETWHIWGIIATQDSFKNEKVYNSFKGREELIENMLSQKNFGINAMTVSELSGIPRATVVRKINKLLKKKLLTVDEKKLYYPGKGDFKKHLDLNTRAIQLLSVFCCKVVNLIRIN